MTEADILDEWMLELHEKLLPLKFGGPEQYRFDLRDKADVDDPIMGHYLRKRFGKYEIIIMATFDTVAVGLHEDGETKLGSHLFFSVLDPDLDDKIINGVQNYVNWIELRSDNDDV